jgi:RWD domain
MSNDDHLREEQEMEAEALTAIFDDCLEVVSDRQPFEWAIRLWPEPHSSQNDGDGGGDRNGFDGGASNHVGIRIVAKIPTDYPEGANAPEFKVEILKGLTHEHAEELLALANEEAQANVGMPVVYAVCERLREWLLENNVTGMDDLSMYAQMMKREKGKELEEVRVW